MSPQASSAARASGVPRVHIAREGLGKAQGFAASNSHEAAPPALPADLAAWLVTAPTRRAREVLGLNTLRLRELRDGRGAPVAEVTLRRWAQHQASAGLPVGAWQIRKVLPSGVVWLAGVQYTSPALAGWVGRQVNVAPLSGGALRVLPLATEGGFDARPLPGEGSES